MSEIGSSMPDCSPVATHCAGASDTARHGTARHGTARHGTQIDVTSMRAFARNSDGTRLPGDQPSRNAASKRATNASNSLSGR
ncbi:hypothetical protein [Burkholderia multivorans]|uniref:hypothetical protein n=1 Tax=Burkholderia multivorans TaxID=87883 RepID=UPI001BA2BF54|nr:hypothetical protein [Burkholderia multivorans]MBR7893086.1 hypothetical protein [Burkholderia multivorans]